MNMSALLPLTSFCIVVGLFIVVWKLAWDAENAAGVARREKFFQRFGFGRFGPYIQVGKLYVSIKSLDPRTITEKEARKLYAEKLKKEAEKYIATFDSGVQIINGPYGPYITDGKKNAKIPKGVEPKSLTEAEAKKILAEAPEKKRFPRRKASRKA